MAVATELSFVLENVPGTLAKVAGLLARQKVNLRAMCAWPAGAFSLIRIVPEDPGSAAAVLAGAGIAAAEAKVATAALPDRPGSLGRAARKLARAKINIEYLYASAAGGETVAVFGVGNAAKASRALAR